MIETLRPFIVTSWYGHRNDEEIPSAVREVWSHKFGREFGRDRGGRQRSRDARGRDKRPGDERPGDKRPGDKRPGDNRARGLDSREQSNVDIAVLDPQGKVVHSFDGFRRPRSDRRGGHRESLAEYSAREIGKAIERLETPPTHRKKRQPKLPDLGKDSGMRVFVRLMDDRMKAYQAPVVEVVRLDTDDWKALAQPTKKRSVDASRLEKWLSQVYPPGVMERVDPRTKKVYGIAKVDGELTLSPAGSQDERDLAILRGKIRLTDEGPGDFTYEGQLDVVLSYSRTDPGTPSVRGVFSGIYPRYDRRRRQAREIPLHAAFESLPR